MIFACEFVGSLHSDVRGNVCVSEFDDKFVGVVFYRNAMPLIALT